MFQRIEENLEKLYLGQRRTTEMEKLYGIQ